jgi:fucose 4-O-acetylase-like acetyltransferase
LTTETGVTESGAGPLGSSRPSSTRRRASGGAWVPGTGLRSREIDAIKGLLIVLIAFGHNVYLGALWLPVNQFVYNFHVICFLLLPFVFPGQPLSGRFAVDRAVRYLVPHYAFFLLACAAYGLQFVPRDLVWVWIRDMSVASLVGSAWTVKAASGFRLYWFLPALLSLVCLRALWIRGGWPVRAGILLASVAVYASISSMSEDVKRYTPLGILPALVAFPLGIASVEAWHRLRSTPSIALRVLPFAAWAAASALIWQWEVYPRVASLKFPMEGVLGLSVYAGLVIAAMVSILIAAPALARIPGLATVGRVSLQVFLIHGLVFSAIRFWLGPQSPASDLWIAMLGVSTLAATLLISTACGIGTERSDILTRLLFPRDLESWLSWRKGN